MKIKKFIKREEGAVAIIAALAFIFISAFSGLVVDMGTAYMKASACQNAADAASYASGTLLPVKVEDNAGIQTVKNKAVEYVIKNGFNEANVVSVELEDVSAGTYNSVRVILTSDVAYSFGPIVGINGTTVNKDAKVKLEPVTSTFGAVPLGIETGRFATILTTTQGKNLVIKYGGGDGTEGFFGALDLDGVKGGGAKDFGSWLAFGYGGSLSIGTVLPVEPGNMAGPTTESFMTRYNQCTHYPGQGGCTMEHFDPDCPRVVIIIVYTLLDSKNIRVDGFAPFVLEGLNGNGEIVASKVTFQTPEGETNGVLGGSSDYGIYRARLVE
ncbi:MAG: TadE/TadG family type IV pilus assembly protein [Christensenellales bacterium]